MGKVWGNKGENGWGGVLIIGVFDCDWMWGAYWCVDVECEQRVCRMGTWWAAGRGWWS